jgi:type IV secretion system protein VirB5
MLRTSDVSSSSLDGYTSGNVDVVGGLRGKANDVYQDLIGRSSQAATESERAAYEQGAREAAVSTGLASNVGDAVTSRREGLDELRGRLGNATSAAERADMSARLQLEQAQMMNDQMALQAVELQRRAKAEADYQRYVALQQSDRASFKAGMGLD